jgi:uncharacterized membrane protein
LAAFVAVSVTEVTGHVANGTEGLLTPAVEAEMLAWPVPIGVTVPAGNIPEVLVTVPDELIEVPAVAMVAMVVSLLDHWKGDERSTVPPAGVAVRSAVMSHGTDRDLGAQTVGSLL